MRLKVINLAPMCMQLVGHSPTNRELTVKRPTNIAGTTSINNTSLHTTNKTNNSQTPPHSCMEERSAGLLKHTSQDMPPVCQGQNVQQNEHCLADRFAVQGDHDANILVNIGLTDELCSTDRTAVKDQQLLKPGAEAHVTYGHNPTNRGLTVKRSHNGEATLVNENISKIITTNLQSAKKTEQTKLCIRDH